MSDVAFLSNTKAFIKAFDFGSLTKWFFILLLPSFLFVSLPRRIRYAKKETYDLDGQLDLDVWVINSTLLQAAEQLHEKSLFRYLSYTLLRHLTFVSFEYVLSLMFDTNSIFVVVGIDKRTVLCHLVQNAISLTNFRRIFLPAIFGRLG